MLLQTKETVLVNVPLGWWVEFNLTMLQLTNSSKIAMKEHFERHLDENLDDYVYDKVIVSGRKVLTAKWVGNAWGKDLSK